MFLGTLLLKFKMCTLSIEKYHYSFPLYIPRSWVIGVRYSRHWALNINTNSGYKRDQHLFYKATYRLSALIKPLVVSERRRELNNTKVEYLSVFNILTSEEESVLPLYGN